MNSIFDVDCRRCPRLAAFLDAVHAEEPNYYCRPVPPFGDPRARLVLVGLAPGMHGANRTGRPFTGDHAGILLYRTLYKFGLASAPQSISRRRWPATARCAHHQLGQMPAAGKQAAARRGQAVQCVSAGRAQAKPGCARDPGAWARLRMPPCCALTACRRPNFALRMARSTSWAGAGCCLIRITAAATTPRRGG